MHDNNTKTKMVTTSYGYVDGGAWFIVGSIYERMQNTWDVPICPIVEFPQRL